MKKECSKYTKDPNVKPQYYVFNISSEKKPGACIGINKYSGTKITLGSIYIIGHDIIFDRKKNY